MFAALLRDVPHDLSPLSHRALFPVVDYSRMCYSGLVPVVDCAAVLGRVDPVLR